MPAGGGAEEKVRRLERDVEEARRVLASKEQQLYAWRRGLDGERRTGDVLASLETRGWVVLHDLHWPGRPFANIDHIAIGPTGIFVIDSKNWSGDVLVRDGVLRQNGTRRSDACEGAAAATAAVAAFLEPQHRSLVGAVVCLVDQPTPEHQPTQAQVLGLNGLAEHLLAGAPRLTAWDVGRIGEYLRGLLGGPRSPAMKTTAALAAAGIAPPEPRRSYGGYRARGLSPRRPRRQASYRRPARRSRASDGVALTLVKVAALVFFALVVLPRMVPAITHSMTDTPSVSPPSVVHPSTSPTPSPHVKTPRAKTTATPTRR